MSELRQELVKRREEIYEKYLNPGAEAVSKFNSWLQENVLGRIIRDSRGEFPIAEVYWDDEVNDVRFASADGFIVDLDDFDADAVITKPLADNPEPPTQLYVFYLTLQGEGTSPADAWETIKEEVHNDGLSSEHPDKYEIEECEC